MAITLDPVIEHRIHRQLERGAFREPSELLAHALDLVESEHELLTRREEIVAKLQRSFEQSERGETYSPDEARAILTDRRATRVAR